VLGFGYWSLAGYVKWKVKRAVMYVGDYEEAVAREANRRGMDGIVCGHIHKAELRPMGPILYCNTGDWVESCTALAEHEDGSLGLITFADQAHEQREPLGRQATQVTRTRVFSPEKAVSK